MTHRKINKSIPDALARAYSPMGLWRFLREDGIDIDIGVAVQTATP
jgi:hypothetical protein